LLPACVEPLLSHREFLKKPAFLVGLLSAGTHHLLKRFCRAGVQEENESVRSGTGVRFGQGHILQNAPLLPVEFHRDRQCQCRFIALEGALQSELQVQAQFRADQMPNLGAERALGWANEATGGG
jgi:hypothetical protein